jgi:NhaA family Na+:H+ antiporter
MIMPVFAFANAGIPLAGLSMDILTQPVPLGIMTGLFFGKQIGVFGFTWLAIKLGIGRIPEGVTWLQIYGVSALCGIGFTMSLFISSLAAEQAGTELMPLYRLGILEGSVLSAITGYLVLRFALKNRQA